MKTRLAIILGTLMVWGVTGCGGGGESAQNEEQPPAQVESMAETAQDQVEAKTQAISEDPSLSEEDKELLTKWANYQSNHDPGAVYTMADLPDWGNYRKLNFTRLNDEQMNLVVHELKTKTCDCPTCGPEWTIDRCLVVKPECTRGLTMAQEVIGRIRVMGK